MNLDAASQVQTHATQQSIDGKLQESFYASKRVPEETILEEDNLLYEDDSMTASE